MILPPQALPRETPPDLPSLDISESWGPCRSLRAVLTVIPPSAVDCLATSLSIYLRKPCDWPLFYFLICPLPSSDGLAYTVASHRPSRLNLNSVGPRINATSPPARQPRRPILLAVGVSRPSGPLPET